MLHYPPLNAYLTVRNAGQALAFYKRAFAAVERYRLTDPQTGSIGHAELEIQGGLLMLSEENPEWGNRSPETLGGTSCKLNLMVPNADESFALAIAAGATELMPPTDMFYGFRSGSLRDPFGHEWMLQHLIKEVSPAEMQIGWEQMLAACRNR